MPTDLPEPGLLEALGDATWHLLNLEQEATRILIAVRGLRADEARTLVWRGWSDDRDVALLRERGATDLIGRLEGAQGEVRGAQRAYNNAVSSVEDLSVMSINEVTEVIAESLPGVLATRIDIEQFSAS